MSLKKPLLLSAALSIFALSMIGCSDELTPNDTSAADTDEAAVGLLVNEETELFGHEEEVDQSDLSVSEFGDRTDASGDAIDAFWFRRHLRTVAVSRDIHIERVQGGPAIAEVTVTRDLSGIFRLFYDDPTGDFLPESIDKRLNATATRNAMFVREGGRDRHRGWRPTAISGLEVVSNPTTKSIVSFEISSESVNRTITDPLALVRIEDLPTFKPNEEVTLTVTTTDESDFVFLHSRSGKHEFESLGRGVFQGTWTTGDREGRRRAAIDVIDEDTLLTEDGAYDSVMWGFIYRIANRPDAGDLANDAGDGPRDGSDG